MNHLSYSASGKHSTDPVPAAAVSGNISNRQRIQAGIAQFGGISAPGPLTGFIAGLTGVPNDRESSRVERSPVA